jgi:PIN domain nuclease of toxin-antitoxin system
LTPQLLLDTHVLVRWLSEPKKLSKDQNRVLEAADHQAQPVAVSAITLMEIALLFGEDRSRLRASARELLAAIQASEAIRIIPLDIEVASEIAALGDALRDPADRTIVATARVHGLRLVTSDQRIIESRLVPVIE